MRNPGWRFTIMALILSGCLCGCVAVPGGSGASSGETATTTYPPLNSQSASQAYGDAQAKMAEAGAVKMECTLSVLLASGEDQREITIDNTVTMSREEDKLYMLSEGTVNTHDQGVTVEYTHYYDGAQNRIYRNMVEKYCYTPNTPAQIIAGIGLVDGPEELPVEAAKYMTFDRRLDGGIRMDGWIPAELLGEEWKNSFLDAAYSTYGLAGDALGAYVLGPAHLEVEIDGRGYLTSFSASYTATIPSSQGDVTMEVEESATYSDPEEPVTLIPPEGLEEYQDAETLNPGGEETSPAA